jgi:RNA polymerase sigma-70 factor (ECF subfamily)
MRQDKQLVRRLKNGDKDALRILYVEHKDFLLTLANALLHDSALAEDVVHDVFVTFTRNIAAFRPTGSLKGYLAVCAANEAKTLLRRKKTHAKTSDFATEPQANQSPCPSRPRKPPNVFGVIWPACLMSSAKWWSCMSRRG